MRPVDCTSRHPKRRDFRETVPPGVSSCTSPFAELGVLFLLEELEVLSKNPTVKQYKIWVYEV